MNDQIEFIEITHLNLEENIGLDIVAFHLASSGACGEPCGVVFVTRDGRVFHTNYGSPSYGLNDSDIILIFPPLALMEVYPFSLLCPKGWNSCYLGLGNHLVVHESIWQDFNEAVKTEKVRRTESGEGDLLYNYWIHVVLAVLTMINKSYTGQ